MALGKRISFHTRRHWILEWIEAQEGKSLADKVWRVIDAAYRADYLARGQAEIARYHDLARTFRYSDLAPQPVLQEMLQACSYASAHYSRAGREDLADNAHAILRAVLHQINERLDQAALSNAD